MWMIVASHLRLTLGQCKAAMPLREAVRWLSFIDKERRAREKWEYYAAHIIAELECGRTRKPMRLDRHLKTFSNAPRKKRTPEDERKFQMELAKSVMASIAGLTGGDLPDWAV